jgi:hypothetical protein
MWMGCADADGATSGLHHDFHDNLYFLHQGTKRFTIFSPNDAEYMYTAGEIEKVFPNGFIKYNGENVRADGAYIDDIRQWKLEIAQEKVDAAKNEYERSSAEEELEKVLDELFDGSLDELQEYCSDEDDTESNDSNGLKGLKVEIESQSRKKQRIDQMPPSFSIVPPNELHMEKLQKFPLMRKATKIMFELEKGEVLYLPVGILYLNRLVS